MCSEAVKAGCAWDAADLRNAVLANGSEDTIPPINLQVLRLRRRFDIGAQLARTIALLAFGEAR